MPRVQRSKEKARISPHTPIRRSERIMSENNRNRHSTPSRQITLENGHTESASPEKAVAPKKRKFLVKGILNPEILAEQLDLYNQNSKSLLLRLPKELLYQTFACLCPEFIVVIKELDEGPRTFAYRRSHPPVHSKTKKKLPGLYGSAQVGPHCTIWALDLPLVCCQTYNMTALLPYKRLVFKFERVSTMHTWLLGRAPAQREAIRHLRFVLFHRDYTTSTSHKRRIAGHSSPILDWLDQHGLANTRTVVGQAKSLPRG
ncbi:hypothetical protein BU23DRAFT_597906 [Bimuria novae-zelandiae CBS 107.79]|uniref:Uncharacterized protein n=1 Tax=Bimuria novae-zelandiae CBS 107.79 TaxID=1447943 RepID=A0A6A5VF82_9PLEO|nr:hypothetical protein BU23DRAFT_597906 [Bimuria novae-zelandiae CBS 107.79]